MVVHRAADGQPVYHESESFEEAARHLEQLRNGGQGADARIYRLQEIPIEVKTYYKVEVPAEMLDGSAPAAPAPAAAAATSAAPVAAPPAPTAPMAAETVAADAAAAPAMAPGAKPEPAGAGANGGRFGLFGKG
jgi:hypothetical protein